MGKGGAATGRTCCRGLEGGVGVSERARGRAAPPVHPPPATQRRTIDVDVPDRVGGIVERAVARGVLVGPVAHGHDLIICRLADEAVSAPGHDVVVVIEVVVTAVACIVANAAVTDHDALERDLHRR